MKTTALALAALLALAQLAPANAAPPKKHKTAHPKNTISQLQQQRKKNHTVRQVTVSPKKSPGAHANQLSKNVNHEVNRESKDVNKFFQGKK